MPIDANPDIVDWVTEQRISQLTGLSVKALQGKRHRGILPEGDVWITFDGRVMYSIKGYNEWLNRKQAVICHQELKSGTTRFVSRSSGTANATEKLLVIPPRPRGFNKPA